MSKPTFEQRCLLAEQCLPDAPYRAMLKKLHAEMLAALAEQPAQKRPQNCGTGYCSCIECVMEPAQPEQEPCLSTDPSAMRPDFKCPAPFCGLIGQCQNKHKPALRQPLTDKQIVD